MLIIEVVQVVFTVAVLVLAADRQAATALSLWTAAGFGASQILSGLDGGLADSFFRLFVAVFATIALDKWRTGHGASTWVAGPAALVAGLVIGWTV
ncbi:hypothetical protein [Streptomyces sp. NPDC001770]